MLLDSLKTGALKLIGTLPSGKHVPLTEKHYARIYQDEVRSFTDYLGFYDYDAEDQVFLFDDGISVGTAFELIPVDVDGKPFENYEQLEIDLRRALTALPERYDDPWILQVFLQDEPIQALIAQIKAYARPEVRNSELSKEWFKTLEEHVRDMSRPQGLFVEHAIGKEFAGRVRRVRCCLYRKFRRQNYMKGDAPIRNVCSPAEEINQITTTFLRSLNAAGVKSRRYTGSDLYAWLVPWFSPQPSGYRDAYAYMIDRPFPGDSEDVGAGFDLATSLFVAKPENDKEGHFYFNSEVHRYVPIQAIDSAPKHGLLTADQKAGTDTNPAIWNMMPPGSILAMTIVVRSQQGVKEHCHRIVKSGKQGSFEAQLAAQQSEEAQLVMAYDKSRKLFSLSMGVYIRAPSLDVMSQRLVDTMTILRGAGLFPIEPQYDLIPIDQFVRNLPMSYSYEHDMALGGGKRSYLTYTHHISRLLPLYGRGTGSGNPGVLFFNRVGEPFLFDPFSKRDRTKTSHGLFFGPTGAGKSATLVYLLLHWMAMFGMRAFIIEKGNSFGLTSEFFKAKGLNVNHVRFTAGNPPSLPPYAETDRALFQLKIEKQTESEPDAFIDLNLTEEINDEDDDDEDRDYLGEMELLTLLMITGAEEDESKKISRPDKFIVRQALIRALKISQEREHPHARPEDVVTTLKLLAEEQNEEHRRSRIRDMASALELWTTGLHGQIFNRYGKTWPESDVTLIDMGILTNDNNNDMLTVAMISLINTITGIGEKYQFDNRETLVVLDEGHVLTTNPMLVKPLVFGVKTWRKLGIWLIQATQNLEDYPGIARKMLNLAEWWYMLVMPEDEIENLSKFKTLSREDRELLSQARKEPGNFTEGVVISDKLRSLYRVVLPALPLALAMTDQDEKAQRMRIMRENLCSELEAAYVIADEIRKKRL